MPREYLLVLAVELPGAQIAGDLSVPGAFPDVLPMPARDVGLHALEVGGVRDDVGVARQGLVPVPVKRGPVPKRMVELLLVDRKTHRRDMLACRVDRLLLLLLTRYGGRVGGVPEYQSVVLRERRLGDVEPVLALFEVVGHGGERLAAAVVEPHVPAVRPAHGVHPPRPGEHRHVRFPAEFRVALFTRLRQSRPPTASRRPPSARAPRRRCRSPPRPASAPPPRPPRRSAPP